MSVRTKILDKGVIVQEQLIRFLIKVDERLTTLEQGETGEISDISALKETVGNASGGLVKRTTDIETAIGDASTEGTILARIKALEDAQTPNSPSEPSG